MPTTRSTSYVCLLAAFVSAALPAETGACDSTACSVATRYADGAFRQGQWRVDVSARHVDQGRRLGTTDGESDVVRPRVDLSSGGNLAPYREVSAAMAFVQVDVAYAVDDATSLYASMPLFRRNAVVHRAMGGDGGGDDAASGIGDLQLGVRRVLATAGRHDWTGTLIAKLPTGASRVAARDGVVDPMMQPGTGSFDFAASLLHTWRLSAATLTSSLSVQKRTESAAGYSYGDEAVVSVGASRSVSSRVTATVQLKGQHARRHHFRGAPLASTGLSLLQAAPGLRFRVSPALVLYATAQAPLYAHANESQLGPRHTVTAGFVKAF